MDNIKSPPEIQLPTLKEELSLSQLGHGHRHKRMNIIAERIEALPDGSVPKMMTSESEREGAYRFFSNPEVIYKELLESHKQQTLTRAKAFPHVLAIHDTSEIVFPGEGERQGIKPLKSGKPGFNLHATMLVAVNGELRQPLGVMNAEVIDYEPKKLTPDEANTSASTRRRNTPFEEKEGYKWYRGVRAIEDCWSEPIPIIHVMDREGDIFELEEMMLNQQSKFVIRVQHNREVLVREFALGNDLQECVHQGRIRMTALQELNEEKGRRQKVKISHRGGKNRLPAAKKRHPNRQAREVELEFKACSISVLRPKDHPRKDIASSLPLNIIWVNEINPPEGEKPIDWILLTTEPIDTLEDIYRVVDYYRARWIIEEFFKALKTGCKYEQTQFETRHALLNILAFYIPMAWIMLYLRSLSRTTPEMKAENVLSKKQIELLRIRSNRVTSDEPTVKEALWAIADLGGHFKHNGEPGWIVLMRGMKSLYDYELGILAWSQMSGEQKKLFDHSPR